jgi:perosamine synthetase
MKIVPGMRYRCNEPLISPRALDNVRQVLEDRYLSPGPWVPRFEAKWAEVCGVKYAVATSSGSSALHIALLASGIGEGDEVIVPAMTCPDTLNMVVSAGAKPVIADIDATRYGLSPEATAGAVTARTRAVIPVHLYGCVVDAGVFDVARARRLLVIEDAAEAHGAQSNGRRAGSLGNMGCFSFRGDKVIGVGTGGMITSDDKRLADRARYLIGLASPGGFDRYASTETCFSYELSNVHAAIGEAQVDILDQTLARKRRVAQWYDELLSDAYFDKPASLPGHAWWKYSPLVKHASPRAVHQRLLKEGIETMPPFTPMYRLPMFCRGLSPDNFPVAEDVYARLISLPTSPYLERKDVEIIVGALHAAIEEVAA